MRSADGKKYILLSFKPNQNEDELKFEIREGLYDGFRVVYDPDKDGECNYRDLPEYLDLSIFGDE